MIKQVHSRRAFNMLSVRSVGLTPPAYAHVRIAISFITDDAGSRWYANAWRHDTPFYRMGASVTRDGARPKTFSELLTAAREARRDLDWAKHGGKR